MSFMRKVFLLPLLILFLVSAFGCATTHPPASGFLGSDITLVPDPADSSRSFWEKPEVNWRRYTKLMIDPVVVYLHPQSRNREIHVDELKKLTDTLRNTVVKTVGPAYPIVDQPGPDVMRIRAAITDIKPASPLMNVVSMAALMIPVDMGEASIEAEFLDSLSNERLAAVTDRKVATPIDLKIHKGFTRWGHVEEAFNAWAAELLKELDAMHR